MDYLKVWEIHWVRLVKKARINCSEEFLTEQGALDRAVSLNLVKAVVEIEVIKHEVVMAMAR